MIASRGLPPQGRAGAYLVKTHYATWLSEEQRRDVIISSFAEVLRRTGATPGNGHMRNEGSGSRSSALTLVFSPRSFITL